MYDHDGHMTLIMANTITVLRTRYVHTKMQEPEFILVTTCSVICKEDGRRRRNQNSFWSQPAELSAKKMEEDAGTRIHSGHNLQRYLQRRWKKTQEPEFILVTTCSVICKEDGRRRRNQNSFWSQPAALSAKKMEEDAGTRIHSGHNLQRYLQRR